MKFVLAKGKGRTPNSWCRLEGVLSSRESMLFDNLSDTWKERQGWLEDWEEPSPLTRISSLYNPLVLNWRPEPHTRIPEDLEVVALSLFVHLPHESNEY